jgi:hypothetical protein
MHVNAVENNFHPFFATIKASGIISCVRIIVTNPKVPYSLNTDPDPAFQKIMDPEPDPEKRILQQQQKSSLICV